MPDKKILDHIFPLGSGKIRSVATQIEVTPQPHDIEGWPRVKHLDAEPSKTYSTSPSELLAKMEIEPTTQPDSL